MLTFIVVRVNIQSQNTLDDVHVHDGPTREGGCDMVEELTVRDGEFYIGGADCVIRVEDTLFRVNLAAQSDCLLHLVITSLSSQKSWNTSGLLTMTPTYRSQCSLFARRACMLTFFLCPL